MASFLFGRGGDNQGEEGGEGEHGRVQGEDDTPEGRPFLNFYCLARIELDFCGRKGK